MPTRQLKTPFIYIYQLLILFLIALSGFLCYSQVFNSFFLSDDFVLIALFERLGPLGLWVNQQHGQSLFFRPVLSLISFWDYRVWGLNPLGYHLTNFGFHLANAVLVGAIAYLLIFNIKLDSQTKTFLSYFSGFIFLLLPSHSEAVAWISARTDVIATFFAFLSFVTYLNYKHFYTKIHLIVSLVTFLLALYCKESIVSYPGLIIGYEFYDYWKNRSTKLNFHWLTILLYFGVLVVYFITRYLKLGTLIGGYGEDIHLNFDWGQLVQNLIIYPTRTFLPPQPNSSLLFWIIALLILIGFSLLSLAQCSRPKLNQTKLSSVFVFLIFAFFICILPAINVSVSPFDTQGERYLYWASGFASIYLSLMLSVLINNIQWNLVLSLIFLIYSGLSLYGINQNWKIAGELSQTLLTSIQTIPPSESVIITSIPDNYRGAYLYRTGLIQGLYLFDSDNRYDVNFKRDKSNQFFENVKFDTNKIVTVVTHTLSEPTDQILVKPLTLNSYQFSLSNPRSYFFTTRKNKLETSDYQVTDIQPQTYTLKLKNQNREQDLLLYSSGQFVKLLD